MKALQKQYEDLPSILFLEEVCQVLRMTKNSVAVLVRKGQLHQYKIGGNKFGRRRFLKDEVFALLGMDRV